VTTRFVNPTDNTEEGSTKEERPKADETGSALTNVGAVQPVGLLAV